MNKSLYIILIIVAIALIAFNFTLIDFDNLLVGDSGIALIGIVASLCAIVLLLLFKTSKKIQDKMNED